MTKDDKKDFIRMIVLLLVTGGMWLYTMVNANATTYYLIDNCDFLYASQEKLDDQVILCLDTIENGMDDLNVRARIMIEQLHARGYYDG